MCFSSLANGNRVTNGRSHKAKGIMPNRSLIKFFDAAHLLI